MMGAKKLVNEKGNNLITAMHHENRQALPASVRILNIDFALKKKLMRRILRVCK